MTFPLMLLLILTLLVVTAVLVRKSRTPHTPSNNGSAAAAPVTDKGIDPGLSSYNTIRLQTVVKEGLISTAMEPPLRYLRDSNGHVHATESCGGAAGSSQEEYISPLELPTEQTCNCADLLALDTLNLEGMVMDAETTLATIQMILSMETATTPTEIAANLGRLEEIVRTDDQRFPHLEAMPLRRRMHALIQSNMSELRKRISSPEMRRRILDSAAPAMIQEGVRNKKPELVLGERSYFIGDEWHQEYVLEAAARSWAEGRLELSREEMVDALMSGALRQTGGRNPQKAYHAEGTSPLPGETKERHHQRVWATTLHTLLRDLVDTWEAETTRLVAEKPSILVLFKQRPRSWNKQTSTLMESHRVSGPGFVAHLPKWAGIVINDDVYRHSWERFQRVNASTLTRDQVETAMVLWDPDVEGAPLSNVYAAITAAALV